jgi:hypothetical protein
LVFKSNVVACIKVNGRILRESGDVVTLPFGCEYSVLIKNLNSVRAQVTVSVDGKDATDGTKLIVAPNSSIELERFIKNGNLQTGNRLKFIERTAGIEAHCGIGSDDGLIRVEAWRELITQRIPVPRPEYYDDPYPVPFPRPWPVYPKRPWGLPMRSTWNGGSGGPLRGMNMGSSSGATMVAHGASLGLNRRSKISAKAGPPPSDQTQRQASRKSQMMDQIIEQSSVSDVGITVLGSQSHQRFVSVAGFNLEPQSTVIILRLRGEVGGMPVAEPITVDRKAICETCGKQNKADAQYCSKCGTALVIYA